MKIILSKKNILIIILFVFFCLPLLIPLFHEGMFVSDDGGWMIVRLSDFHQSLKDGQFPVRWGSRLNHGYGYPVFNFLYPGVLYLGEIIHLVGFNFTNSIKILFGLGMLCSGIFSYLWLKNKFSVFPALIGSFVYLYAPYHLFDLYKRGSLGEIVALAVVPAIFYFLDKKNSLFIGLSACLLILSHNTLALLFLTIIFIYSLIPLIYPISPISLYPERQRRNISLTASKQNLISLVLGVLSSAFFFIPALYDRQFTIFDSVAVSNWQEYFLTPKNIYLLGWGSILVLLIVLIIFFIKVKPPNTQNAQNTLYPERQRRTSSLYPERQRRTITPITLIALIFLSVSLVAIFLASPFSFSLWQILPLPKLVQFPWRFLAISILGVSFLSAWLVSQSGKVRILVGGALVMLFFIPSLSYLRNLSYLSFPDSYFTTNEDSTTVKKEYLPIWANLNPPTERSAKLYEVYLGQADIQIIKNKSNNIILKTILSKPANLKINKLYFPGWNLKINDQKLNFNNPYYQLSTVYQDGLIRIPLLPTTKKIELYWQETPVRIISDLISLGSLLGLIIYSQKYSKR